MDEILYIANIDARPWKKPPNIGSTIPLVLFFASMETMRTSLNVSSDLPSFQKYCVTIVLVVLGMYMSKRCPLPWRKAYTSKLSLDLIYVCLISTGTYNAARQFGPFRDWLVGEQNNFLGWLDNRYVDSGTIMHVIFATVPCAIGTVYIWWRTEAERRSEAVRLANRSSNHLFLHFRDRERRALRLMYLLYLFGSAGLVSFLTMG